MTKQEKIQLVFKHVSQSADDVLKSLQLFSELNKDKRKPFRVRTRANRIANRRRRDYQKKHMVKMITSSLMNAVRLRQIIAMPTYKDGYPQCK